MRRIFRRPDAAPDVPDLDFTVESAAALPFAAAPTVQLRLAVRNRDPRALRSIALTVQVRIATTQRPYTADEQARLRDLFGEPSRWGQTLQSLLWTVTTVQVPAFEGRTVVDLAIPCTYDFEVATARYFDALSDGVIPLELLFSGTVFYIGQAGLQVERISWDKEARYSMPVRVWKDVMALYFPNSAWLRVHRATFDRLASYRTRNALPTWDAALERLLRTSEEQEPARAC